MRKANRHQILTRFRRSDRNFVAAVSSDESRPWVILGAVRSVGFNDMQLMSMSEDHVSGRCLQPENVDKDIVRGELL